MKTFSFFFFFCALLSCRSFFPQFGEWLRNNPEYVSIIVSGDSEAKGYEEVRHEAERYSPMSLMVSHDDCDGAMERAEICGFPTVYRFDNNGHLSDRKFVDKIRQDPQIGKAS